jgi:hypothetical protein
MNEQIEKLIVELEPDAFMTYKGYLYHANDPKVLEHSDPEPLYTRQELDKFALLLIRKCAEISSDCGAYKPEYAIKKHFGIEE